MFVLRSRRSKNPSFSIFEAEGRRTPHLESSIFESKDRRPLASSIFEAEEWVEDRTGEGGGLLRRWGGGSSKIGGFFHLLGPKNEEPPHLPLSRAEERRTSLHVQPSRPEERTKNLSVISSSSLPAATGSFSYPEMWIFRLIFYIEGRSDDRDRPSTYSLGEPIRRCPVLPSLKRGLIQTGNAFQSQRRGLNQT